MEVVRTESKSHVRSLPAILTQKLVKLHGRYITRLTEIAKRLFTDPNHKGFIPSPFNYHRLIDVLSQRLENQDYLKTSGGNCCYCSCRHSEHRSESTKVRFSSLFHQVYVTHLPYIRRAPDRLTSDPGPHARLQL